MKHAGTFVISVLLALTALAFPHSISSQDTLSARPGGDVSLVQLSFPVQSGNHQYQLVDFELPEPIRARVTDSVGNPVEGVRVWFRTAEMPGKAGKFHCSPPDAVSNKEGLVTARVTLGPDPGQYQVIARIQGDADADTLLFSFHARGRNWLILLISGLLGGLALFLWGMKMMSSGMQNSAGDRMRSILGNLTKNRIVAMFMGILITTAIQSSSATSVKIGRAHV